MLLWGHSHFRQKSDEKAMATGQLIACHDNGNLLAQKQNEDDNEKEPSKELKMTVCCWASGGRQHGAAVAARFLKG